MAIKTFRAFQTGYRLLNGSKLNDLFGFSAGGTYGIPSEQIAGANIYNLTVTNTFTAVSLSLTGNLTVTGNVAVSGYTANSVASALTAAGTNRGTALVISHQINNITTAAASTGVVLPLGTAVGLSAPIVIFNGGANAITVYAAGSDTIDTVAGATGVGLTNAKRCIYYPVSVSGGNTTWISAQLGVISA